MLQFQGWPDDSQSPLDDAKANAVPETIDVLSKCAVVNGCAAHAVPASNLPHLSQDGCGSYETVVVVVVVVVNRRRRRRRRHR